MILVHGMFFQNLRKDTVLDQKLHLDSEFG